MMPEFLPDLQPASYVSFAMRPGGLQDYVDVWNELN